MSIALKVTKDMVRESNARMEGGTPSDKDVQEHFDMAEEVSAERWCQEK